MRKEILPKQAGVILTIKYKIMETKTIENKLRETLSQLNEWEYYLYSDEWGFFWTPKWLISKNELERTDEDDEDDEDDEYFFFCEVWKLTKEKIIEHMVGRFLEWERMRIFKMDSWFGIKYFTIK